VDRRNSVHDVGDSRSFLPPIPGTTALSRTQRAHLRALNGVPGSVLFSGRGEWFGVWGRAHVYHLPYFKANMSLGRGKIRLTIRQGRRDALSFGEFFAAEAARFLAPRTQSAFGIIRGPSSRELTIGNHCPNRLRARSNLSHRTLLPLFLHRDRLYRSRIFHEPGRCGVQRSMRVNPR